MVLDIRAINTVGFHPVFSHVGGGLENHMNTQKLGYSAWQKKKKERERQRQMNETGQSDVQEIVVMIFKQAFSL